MIIECETDFFPFISAFIHNLCHKNTGTASFLNLLLGNSTEEFGFHDDRPFREMTFSKDLVVTLKQKV